MFRTHESYLMPASGEAFSDGLDIDLRTTSLGIGGVAPIKESNAKQPRIKGCVGR
jgi:hypothetical protein